MLLQNKLHRAIEEATAKSYGKYQVAVASALLKDSAVASPAIHKIK